MHDANHPIWPIIRIAVIFIALCVILSLTCEKLDMTEVKTLVGMFVALLGVEGGVKAVTARQSH